MATNCLSKYLSRSLRMLLFPFLPDSPCLSILPDWVHNFTCFHCLPYIPSHNHSQFFLIAAHPFSRRPRELLFHTPRPTAPRPRLRALPIIAFVVANLAIIIAADPPSPAATPLFGFIYVVTGSVELHCYFLRLHRHLPCLHAHHHLLHPIVTRSASIVTCFASTRHASPPLAPPHSPLAATPFIVAMHCICRHAHLQPRSLLTRAHSSSITSLRRLPHANPPHCTASLSAWRPVTCIAPPLSTPCSPFAQCSHTRCPSTSPPCCTPHPVSVQTLHRTPCRPPSSRSSFTRHYADPSPRHHADPFTLPPCNPHCIQASLLHPISLRTMHMTPCKHPSSSRSLPHHQTDPSPMLYPPRALMQTLPSSTMLYPPSPPRADPPFTHHSPPRSPLHPLLALRRFLLDLADSGHTLIFACPDVPVLGAPPSRFLDPPGLLRRRHLPGVHPHPLRPCAVCECRMEPTFLHPSPLATPAAPAGVLLSRRHRTVPCLPLHPPPSALPGCQMLAQPHPLAPLQLRAVSPGALPSRHHAALIPATLQSPSPVTMQPISSPLTSIPPCTHTPPCKPPSCLQADPLTPAPCSLPPPRHLAARIIPTYIHTSVHSFNPMQTPLLTTMQTPSLPPPRLYADPFPAPLPPRLRRRPPGPLQRHSTSPPPRRLRNRPPGPPLRLRRRPPGHPLYPSTSSSSSSSSPSRASPSSSSSPSRASAISIHLLLVVFGIALPGFPLIFVVALPGFHLIFVVALLGLHSVQLCFPSSTSSSSPSRAPSPLVTLLFVFIVALPGPPPCRWMVHCFTSSSPPSCLLDVTAPCHPVMVFAGELLADPPSPEGSMSSSSPPWTISASSSPFRYASSPSSSSPRTRQCPATAGGHARPILVVPLFVASGPLANFPSMHVALHPQAVDPLLAGSCLAHCLASHDLPYSGLGSFPPWVVIPRTTHDVWISIWWPSCAGGSLDLPPHMILSDVPVSTWD